MTEPDVAFAENPAFLEPIVVLIEIAGIKEPESFVDGVGWAGKKADLLAGDHGYRTFPGEQIQGRSFALGLAIGASKRRNQGGTTFGRILDAGARALIKRRNPVKMILKIGKQRRCVRDLSVSKTGRLHDD